MILDLPATWERLDTLGIPVVGFGTSEFPGFYTVRTGIPLTTRADSVAEVACIAAAHFGLNRIQAVLVVQPPPVATALEAEAVERAVAIGLAEAARQGVWGGDVTPYLLAAVSRETGGKSLAANLALLESNARLAAEIAVSFSVVFQSRRVGR